MGQNLSCRSARRDPFFGANPRFRVQICRKNQRDAAPRPGIVTNENTAFTAQQSNELVLAATWLVPVERRLENQNEKLNDSTILFVRLHSPRRAERSLETRRLSSEC